MSQPDPAAVIFDFFNTLVEVDRDRPSLATVLTEMGFPCPRLLEEAWSSDAYDGCETPALSDNPGYMEWRMHNLTGLARHAGVPASAVEQVAQQLEAHDRGWTVKPCPGASDLIADLASHHMPYAICSNADDDLTRHLKQSGLSGFTTVVSSAAVGARKPHMRPFVEVTSSIGLYPEDCLYVGNAWATDICGALRAGYRPVWITRERTEFLPGLVLQFRQLRDFHHWLYPR